MSGASEFDEIERLFRPLTAGAPGAFDLLDDAAVLPKRKGHEIVVTKDALVAGVHFPGGEAPGLIARKLLRTNLSDLAAKGAEPFAAFLAIAWRKDYGPDARAAFAAGLAEDLAHYGVALMGGDTVSTAGPLTASLTAMGWVREGRMIRRAGAQVGDRILVSGTIGDGALGLAVERGEIVDLTGFLAGRYRLPNPRVDLRRTLRARAAAAADVSDGLVADTGHIAKASGVRIELDLGLMPLSSPAQAWVTAQADVEQALLRLAVGGDDYEVVCATNAAGAVPRGFTEIGRVVEGAGVGVHVAGRPLDAGAGGWRHG